MLCNDLQQVLDVLRCRLLAGPRCGSDPGGPSCIWVIFFSNPEKIGAWSYKHDVPSGNRSSNFQRASRWTKLWFSPRVAASGWFLKKQKTLHLRAQWEFHCSTILKISRLSLNWITIRLKLLVTRIWPKFDGPAFFQTALTESQKSKTERRISFFRRDDLYIYLEFGRLPSSTPVELDGIQHFQKKK